MRSEEAKTKACVDAEIIDRGRGPEIKGTRVTVYDVLDYALECWPPERIAVWFKIRPQQVEAAIDYVRDHSVEVLTNYVKILERCEKGNQPEVQARLDAGRHKVRELVQQIRQVKARAEADIRDLIKKHRQSRVKENGDARDHGGQ
jgi:uncharacterized protein (DUF433 family)